MPIYVKFEKREYAQAPEGLHQAVCVDVVDLGMVDGQWGPKPMIRLVFQTEARDPEKNERFLVLRQFGKNLSPKGKLRPFLESWRGRKFTEEELAGFDLEKLIGANCQLQIVHEISTQGNEFANVQAIISAPKGAAKLVAENYVRVQDRAEGGAFVAGEEDVPF